MRPWPPLVPRDGLRGFTWRHPRPTWVALVGDSCCRCHGVSLGGRFVLSTPVPPKLPAPRCPHPTYVHPVINDNVPFALSFSLLIFKAIKSTQTALCARGVTAPPTRTPSNGTGGLYILSELFVSAKSPPSLDSLCLCGIIY